MTKPMTIVFDVTTMEEIIREMTDEEYAQYLIDVSNAKEKEAKQAEAKALEEAKKVAKAEALAALGLSQEVINLLAE